MHNFKRGFASAAFGLFANGCLLLSTSLRAAPPRYDHVVIVVEENRTVEQIVGDLVNAPYITSLATGGVSMASMFAIEHPSQPNYLQLFSGGNQGVLDDNLPLNFSVTPTATYPFTTPNLGAEIIAAGFTFAGYSEQIEAAGAGDYADYDPHSATEPNVHYRRKHNPWANWVAKVSPVPANQLTGTVNRAFTQFPTNFNLLPTVSIIVPNQLNDMHDGSRKMGDDWLLANLNAYAVWARTNNSLLIITWDEDDYNQDNQIATVFHGANLRNGTVAGGTWTLHHLLRTLEDMYGTTHAGSAAQTRAIVGPFATDPTVVVATFRQGLNGYTNARDTQLWQEFPDTNYALNQDVTADLDTGAAAGNQVGQVLVRFDNLFGAGVNQVPTNAVIYSAKLICHTPLSLNGADFDSNDTFRSHRMIMDWTDTATWNSTSGGISANDVEAATTASFSAVPDVDGGPTIFDVTADVELFKAGTANRGWVIRPSSAGTGDGWTFRSSDYTTNAALRPALEIVYSLPTPYSTWAAARGLTGLNNGFAADPDHDGANNLTEFSYNLNPLVVDARPVSANGTNGLPAARFLPNVSNGILEVDFIRRKGPNAAGLSYTNQFSGHLTTWANGLTPTVTSLNAEWERVTVRDSVSGPNARRFARVVLGLQP